VSSSGFSKSLGIAATALALVLATPSAGLAQQLDSSAIAAARELGAAGVALFEKGDYAQASDRLERAYGIVRIPTFGLWSARALDKTGRLLEAGERYRDVLRIPIKPTDPEVFRTAARDAQAENDALTSRIPQLVIEVSGVPAGSANVSIDGRALPAQLVGVPIPVNPGARHVEARSGGQVATRDITLAEGKQERVVLALSAAGEAPPQAAPVPMMQPQPSAQPVGPPIQPAPAPPPVEADTGKSPTAAWVALGIGGAGLVAGGIFGALALSEQSKLKDECPGDVCGPSRHGDVDGYNAKRMVAFIGLGVGVVGAAVGTVLLVTSSSPKKEQAQGPRIEPWIGIGSVGARGRF
jgi:hypothetical protein